MDKYGNVLENVLLKDYNTYKIGGKAKYLVKPYNIDSLKELINYLRKNSIKYFIIGNGSNIILPDEDYEGCVISLFNLNNISIKDKIVSVESGINLNKMINEIICNNLGGIENLYGIPGTLGGAIVQNAGCYNTNISDNLVRVTYLENNEIYTIDKNDCCFGYRDSIFKHDKNKIILSCIFEFNNKDKDSMMNIVKYNIIKRKNSQPLEYPNAGSVFRNSINNSAGKLIDDAGLKGYNICDAYVSLKHANFIINKGNAKSKDIIKLIEYIRNKVKSEHNIDLELEQEIIKY